MHMSSLGFELQLDEVEDWNVSLLSSRKQTVYCKLLHIYNKKTRQFPLVQHMHLHNTHYEQLLIYQYMHTIMTLNLSWIMKDIAAWYFGYVNDARNKTYGKHDIINSFNG